MDAVMLVEALDDHGNVDARHRVHQISGHCLIGRSLNCDLILDDAYAAAEHTRLTLLPDGRVLVQDLGTQNGTRVDGRRVDAEAGQIIDGGELRVGRTRLRVRTRVAALPPERLFRRDFLRRYRTLLAVLGLVLCFAFAAMTQWMGAPDRLAPRVVIAELIALCGLALWVASWSLVSRLTVGAWQLRIHMSIAAFCVAIWAWGYGLYSLLSYALQWRWLGIVMALLAGVVALAAAYLHLRNATRFLRPASLMLAALAPLICGGVWWLVDLQLDPRTVNRVSLGAKVYPSLLRLAPSTDLGDYLADSDELKRNANRNRQASLLETPIYDVDE